MDYDAFIRTETRIQSPPLTPELRLYLAAEFTPLWQMTEESLRENNLPPPFWAIAWPGGQAMARYILDNPDLVAGKRVLDFATGSGIAAIAAARAGAAAVTAVDIDAFALAAVPMNAALNGVSVRVAGEQDISRRPTATDVILAGDICYEQSMSTRLMRWLLICADQGMTVLLADPGRAYLPETGLTRLHGYDVPTSMDIEDREMRHATIWRLEKPAD